MTLRIKEPEFASLVWFLKAKEWFAATLSHDWYWWERHYRSIWIHWTTEQMGTWFQNSSTFHQVQHVTDHASSTRSIRSLGGLFQSFVITYRWCSTPNLCGPWTIRSRRSKARFQISGGQVRRWPCKGPWGLDGFSRAKTSFTGPTRLIPVRTSVKTMWAVWAYRLVLKLHSWRLKSNWMPFLLRAGRLVQKLGLSVVWAGCKAKVSGAAPWNPLWFRSGVMFHAWDAWILQPSEVCICDLPAWDL